MDQGSDLTTLAPAERFFAIGDIHGRLDLLQGLLAALDGDCPLVFVGDYIDRGDYSAQVLHHLRHLNTSPGRRVICLMGNHEDMLLSFLDDPAKMGRIWLQNGGAQTLASFGLTDIDTANFEPEAVADRLRPVMGAPLLDWLQNRPLTWTSGNVTAVHAGLDPAKRIDAQPGQVCLWGHPKFARRARRDGHWVVHGHTIVTEPRVAGRVVSIDTGAFATDHLTAAEISDGAVRFVTTGRTGIMHYSA